MSFFAAFLDERIAVVEAPLSGNSPELPIEEAASVAMAVPRRRREFAAGRACARQAMAALGHAPVALPCQRDRTPLWPQGLVGSITHTDAWTAAAVARRDQGFASVGIDLEPADGLPADLWSSVCTADEQARVVRACHLSPEHAAHVLFCMKEAAFKCQYPISATMLEFADFAIEVDAPGKAFTAVYQRAAGPFSMYDRIHGRFAIGDGHFASVATITMERMP